MPHITFNVFDHKSKQWQELTLNDGQCFEHAGGGGSEDSYAYWSETYVYDADEQVVRRCQEDWGANESGPYERSLYTVCPVDKLDAIPVNDDVRRPDWELDHSQVLSGEM